MGPAEIVLVLAVGLAAGVLAGMFGIGGASLTTPGIRAAGATPLEAVGSTIPAILPGAVAGAWHYAREDLVEWRVALVAGAVGSVSAVGGAELSDHIDGSYLMLVIAAMLLWTGLAELRKARARRPERQSGARRPERQSGARRPERQSGARSSVPAGRDSPPARTPAPDERPGGYSVVAGGAVGTAAGLMAGLLGVGGGVLLLPGFARMHMEPKRAVGSSLVAVAILSIPAMITQAALGHVNWDFALLLVVGVVPGARVGARFTLKGSNRRLRILMGLLFIALALVFGGSELAAIAA